MRRHAKDHKSICRNSKKLKLINGNKINLYGSIQHISSSKYYQQDQESVLNQSYLLEDQLQSKLDIKDIYNKHQLSIRISDKKFDWRRQFKNRQDNFQMIKQIRLTSCQVTYDNLEIFASMKWQFVQTLSITVDTACYTQIRAYLNYEEIAVLMSNKWSSLKHLYIQRNRIGDKGFEQIIYPELPSLCTLDVGCNQITHVGLQCLPLVKLNSLTTLLLHNNKINKIGIQLLTKANLPQLENIALSDCQIGDEGAKYLVKGHWPNLQRLSINDNQINMKGYECLSHNNWKKLKNLYKVEWGWVCCSGLEIYHKIGLSDKTIQLLTFMSWPSFKNLMYINYQCFKNLLPEYAAYVEQRQNVRERYRRE